MCRSVCVWLSVSVSLCVCSVCACVLVCLSLSVCVYMKCDRISILYSLVQLLSNNTVLLVYSRCSHTWKNWNRNVNMLDSNIVFTNGRKTTIPWKLIIMKHV